MKLLLILIASVGALATDLNFAPSNFAVNGKQMVFVDMKTAHYEIVYDVEHKKAFGIATINFEMPSDGRALFDMVSTPLAVQLNEQETQAKEVSFPQVSSAWYVDKKIEKGNHTLSIFFEISRLIQASSGNIQSAYWMTDLSDRGYLEKYLPTNLDFDKIKMSFDIKIEKTQNEHTIKVNCPMNVVAKNHFQIDCPDYYTSSLLFFHLHDVGRFQEITKTYKSIDKRDIQIIVYTKLSTNHRQFMIDALDIIAELERDYGPWPHPQMIIYGEGRGGMEYAGATRTSLRALGHEMHHSYFARAMTPTLGNGGWIDEALAVWRDNGSRSYGQFRISPTRMAGHSIYRRHTDTSAYSKGERLIGHLDKKFKDNHGTGMLKFLKDWYSKRQYQNFNTQTFQNDLELYFDTSLGKFFSQYIYGDSSDKSAPNYIEAPVENPYHPKLSEKELMSYL